MRRKNASRAVKTSFSSQEVNRFIVAAPERTKQLMASSLQKCEKHRRKNKNSSSMMAARLEESIKLFDEAVRLFAEAYKRRAGLQGVSKRKVSQALQQWLSEPTEYECDGKYFRLGDRSRF